MRYQCSAGRRELERRSRRSLPRRAPSESTSCLLLLAAAAIGACAARLAFSDPAWSTATAAVFWVALAGVVAWALKRLGVGAEALRLIKAVRGK